MPSGKTPIKNRKPRSFAGQLLVWYDRHGRALPWRESPKDPYHVWLSEIMLQQTTVATVLAYHRRFIQRWPTIKDFANADIADLLSAWSGLGYYRRCHLAHRCAKMVVAQGGFPRDVASLRALPGIGAYTAPALASILYNAKAPAIDGNVQRLVARLLAIDVVPTTRARQIHDYIKARIPHARRADFTQALMELGGQVCRPKNPDCANCPVRHHCAAVSKNLTAHIPVKPARKVRPDRYGVAFCCIDPAGRLLLRRRPDQGLLPGTSEVPTTPWQDKRITARDLAATPALAQTHVPICISAQTSWQIITPPVRHIFTHFRLSLHVAITLVPRQAAPKGYHWAGGNRLHAQEPLSTLMRRVIECGLAGTAHDAVA
ncbi:MAG: A/G-specific adenine glycosylase [Pseudomonadota bacterium]